jgi:CDP-4-dehydro-6-deoxyglucose reductase
MPRIRLIPGRQVVECRHGQPVLEALEEAGLPWPNDCRAGHCGTCRARCVAGMVDHGVYLPMALPDESLADGYFLPCVATPGSDVIDVISLGAGAGPPGVTFFAPRRQVACTVAAKLPRTPDIVEVRLRPAGERLRYWPGQYIEVHVPRLADRGRPYSIANRPRPDGVLCLHVSRQLGGMASTWIHDELAAGATVSVSGPYGTFTGGPQLRGPVLCLASGSGLAPILALTEAALHRGYPDPVLLLFSARTPADLYAQELIGSWRRRHGNFRFERTITRPSPRDPRPHGRIPDVLHALVSDLSAHHVFIAGSPGFVTAAREASLTLGAAPARVRVENYFAGP